MRFLTVLLGVFATVCVSHQATAAVDVHLASAETPLNGPWRFRFGDDPAWAAPGLDDRTWESVSLAPAPGATDGDVGLPGYVSGWTARGHRGRFGHAWYRLHVRWSVPAGSRPVLLGPALVDGTYEIFWNGRRVGGIGRFDTDPPRSYATRPTRLELPTDASSGEAVVAVHVYLPEAMAGDHDAGGMHIAPILADGPAADARHVVQWWQTFWGYVVDVVEPVLLLLLALLALSLRRFREGDRFWVSAAIALVIIAALRLNQPLFFWAEFEEVQTYLVARHVVLEPLAIAAWLAAWNRWLPCPDRRADVAAATLALAAGAAALGGDGLETVRMILRLGLFGLFAWIAFRVVRGGPHRRLALPTMLAVGVALFGEELWALGVPGIWFPFGVGVSRTQVALAVAIVLLAAAFHRRAEPRTQARAIAPPAEPIAPQGALA